SGLIHRGSAVEDTPAVSSPAVAYPDGAYPVGEASEVIQQLPAVPVDEPQMIEQYPAIVNEGTQVIEQYPVVVNDGTPVIAPNPAPVHEAPQPRSPYGPITTVPMAAAGIATVSLQQRDAPELPLRKGFQKKVGAADDYSWVTGQLFFVHVDGGLWVVRYASP